MKKFLVLFSVMSGGFICLHAQTAPTPKLAAYSIDSVSTVHTGPAPKQVLAPMAIDSTATATPTPVPELRATKQDDPVAAPKH